MSENSSNAKSGIGFGGLLTILFIGLKLGNVITWAWFWVLSPTLIPIMVVLICILAAVIVESLGDR